MAEQPCCRTPLIAGGTHQGDGPVDGLATLEPAADPLDQPVQLRSPEQALQAPDIGRRLFACRCGAQRSLAYHAAPATAMAAGGRTCSATGSGNRASGQTRILRTTLIIHRSARLGRQNPRSGGCGCGHAAGGAATQPGAGARVRPSAASESRRSAENSHRQLNQRISSFSGATTAALLEAAINSATPA